MRWKIKRQLKKLLSLAGTARDYNTPFSRGNIVPSASTHTFAYYTDLKPKVLAQKIKMLV